MTLPATEQIGQQLMAYDRGGRRLWCRDWRSLAKNVGSFTLRDVLPEDISAVTWAERPLNCTFHNILLPTGGGADDVPPRLAEYARRLGHPGATAAEIRGLEASTTEERLAVADVSVGPHALKVVEGLFQDAWGRPTPGARERGRRAPAASPRSMDPKPTTPRYRRRPCRSRSSGTPHDTPTGPSRRQAPVRTTGTAPPS